MKATLPVTTSSNLTVINGTATETLSGATLTITLPTDKTVLSWVNFWDGTANGGTSAAGDVINYSLPSASTSVLNYVSGGLLTTINGEILSNGKVILENPAGVTISATGIVNTASFGISTIAENFANYESTGTLTAFGSQPSTGGGTITVTPGASITTAGGNVYLAAQNINLSGTVTGNALLYGTSGGNIFVGNGTTTATGTTISGNLSINALGDGVYLNSNAALALNLQGNLSIYSGGGNIFLTNGGSTVVTGSSVIDSSSSTTNGAVEQAGGGTFTNVISGTTTSINTATGGNPALTGATSPGSVTLTSADFASLSIVSGPVNITETTGATINLGTTNIYGYYNVTAAGNITSSGNVSVTAANTAANFYGSIPAGYNGTINLVTSGSKTIAFTTSAAQTTFGTITTGTGSATITSTGAVVLGTVTAPTLTVSASGSISEMNGAFTGLHDATAANLTSTSGGIYLDADVNSLGVVKLVGAPLGTYIDSGAMTLGNGTATTGAVTIYANGNVAIGTAASDVVSIGGALGLDLAGGASGANTLTTVANAFTVTGNVSLVGNNDTFTLGTAASTSSSFGAIGISDGTGTVSVYEAGTTNLGGTFTFLASATTANGGYTSPLAATYGATGTTVKSDVVATLNVTSGANIINTSGLVNVSGTLTVTAGTTSAPGTIQIGTSTTPADVATITDGLSSSLTLFTNVAPTVSSAVSTTLGSLYVDDSALANAAITVSTTGTVGFTSVGFNTTGSFSYTNDPSSVTLTNATNTNASSPTFALTTTGTASITLGTGVNLGSYGANSITAGGSIVDTAGSSFYIGGATSFTAGTSNSGSIYLANGTNNNVGTVALALAGTDTAGSITYAEGGTVKLSAVTVPAGNAGTVSITSYNGDVIESGALTFGSTALTGVTFSAPSGAVILTATNNIGTTAAAAVVPISITAKNNSSYVVDDSVLFGKVTISNGTFTVNTTADATGAILQKSGTSIYTYGNDSFTTAGAAISLTNSGNNFGAITIDTTNGGAVVAGANVSVHETATDNYAGINTGTGTFTALDDSGDIIETPGAIIKIGGLTTLTATSGNIYWGNPVSGSFTTGSNTLGGVNGVLATAAGNITLVDANTTETLLINGTKAGGNLSISNTGGGYIADSGSTSSITAVGNAYFSTNSGGAGYLNLTGLNNSFGAITLSLLGSGTSTLFENATTNLAGGSLIAGAITFNTGGNFITSGSGTIASNGAVTIDANGSIVFSNVWNIAGQLTVKAIAGPTNLSIDSKSANLNGITPINQGNTTNYTGPTP